MAVGQSLASPESGWRRYDDSVIDDATIPYNASASGFYMNSVHSTTTANQYANFEFTGTKLRILTSTATNYASSVSIIIDGVQEFYQQNYATGTNVIVYEKINLTNVRHKVTITSVQPSVVTSIDAIDVDARSKVYQKNEIDNFQDIAIGKKIRANYYSSSNLFGSLGNFGEETNTIIPVSGTATPNGDFYFYVTNKIDNKYVLLADRNIQTGISYTTLNNAGLNSTNGLIFNETYYVDVTNGLDTNAGTQALPFKTIDKAVASASTSSKIKIASGVYPVTNLHGLATIKNLTFIGENASTIIEIANCPQNFAQPSSTSAFFHNLVIRPSNTLSGDNRFIWYNTASVATTFKLRFSNVLFTKSLNDTYPTTNFFIWANTGTVVPDVLFDNCAIKASISFESAGANTGTRYQNSAFSFNRISASTIMSRTCLLNATFDTNNRLTNAESTWKNVGTGVNIDGTVANIGLYGGKFQWDAYAFVVDKNKYNLKLPTGGNSQTDTNNDWDNYIVNSSLNNTIIAGSDAIWNWSGKYSLTSNINNNNVTVRGNTASNGFSTTSNTTLSNFRPLVIVEVYTEYINANKDLNGSLTVPFQRVGDIQGNLFIPPKGYATTKVAITAVYNNDLNSSLSINSVSDLSGSINIPLHGTASVKSNVIQPPRTIVNLKPVQDSFVSSSNPRLNYGTTGDLLIGYRQSDNSIYRSLLKFDLSGISTDMKVTKGTLKLYFDYENETNLPFEIDTLAGSWTENGVTYANQPSIVQKIAESQVGQTRGYVEINIIDTVSAWQKQTLTNNGIMLKSLNEALNIYYRFYSRENLQYPPLLEVEYYDPTPKSYDYGDLSGSIKINRYSNKDLSSKLQIKALFENKDLKSTIHLTNLNLMIEGSLTVIRDNLNSKIIVKQKDYSNLDGSIIVAQYGLNDLEGSLSVNPIYLKGNIKIKRTENNDLSGTFIVKELLNDNLSSTINVSNPNLKGSINIKQVSDINGSINIKYAGSSNIPSSIFVIGKGEKDISGSIDIVHYEALQGIFTINSGYLESSIIVPYKAKKDLPVSLNIRTFYAEDLFSSLAVGQVIDLPAELEIILGRPNNFILYF